MVFFLNSLADLVRVVVFLYRAFGCSERVSNSTYSFS